MTVDDLESVLTSQEADLDYPLKSRSFGPRLVVDIRTNIIALLPESATVDQVLVVTGQVLEIVNDVAKSQLGITEDS